MWQTECESLRIESETAKEELGALKSSEGSVEEKLSEFKSKWGAEVMERKKLANDVEVA